MRVYYPMLIFDGLEEAKVKMARNSVTLALRDGTVRFEVLEPSGVKLQRTGQRLDFRNGEAEAACAEIRGLRAVYRITGKR